MSVLLDYSKCPIFGQKCKARSANANFSNYFRTYNNIHYVSEGEKSSVAFSM